MTKVKICGITNYADARHAAESGADALGFNFFAGSKRFISPTDAATITTHLTAPVLKVGVFVNETIENIIATQATVVLNIIQLHGDESVDFVAALRERTGAKIIKAFRVNNGFDPNVILNFKADAILLDSFSDSERGGTGKTLDWQIARAAALLVDELYLAGGLSSENVADAINAVNPYAVDACSLLEIEPGRKDHAKVEKFIAAAKSKSDAFRR